MEVAVKGKAKRKHLNAQECDELARSSVGTDALTQCPSSNQGMKNRDPNRGLYPRTPTKRRRPASASGSPSGNQKAINDFFSITKVISSSPHKPPLPSTSTFPKGGSEVVEEEEDDDESLLAVPLDPGLEAVEEEYEEIDDDSLLAAEMASEPGAGGASRSAFVMAANHEEKADTERDYLEGMTAELFGDDEEFDKYLNCEEEEVEPLPDSHFGLLGTSNMLVQPQGCIDDLPEEVLRQVLCLVPAQDLYRSVNLVCHRWRKVVQDPKFVPCKKQYFRYLMREKETVQEINQTLCNNGITHPRSSKQSIRSLVLLMANYKVGERVRPEDVLECVKKHRLFPLAEASIRSRIPDIQKILHLGIEGLNPYAAMAAILILGESVEDVQALVSLLSGCMSPTAITEYLSHMAMMLLALERHNIKISNRLHYNIYYVLHLLENGPFSVSSGQNELTQIQLTGEQQRILCHQIQKDHVVKIIAFAGTGKTTTLMKYAEQNPHIRFLYVAFNNSVACEARQRFPSNVDCRTAHSLAYNDVGKRYMVNRKLNSNLRPFSINYVLPSGHGGFSKAKVIATTINTFMASADQDISIRHVPHDYLVRKGIRHVIEDDEKWLFVSDAKMIWSKMKNLEEKSKQAFYMTHDGYLKLWQLQNPKPCLSDRYDVLLIDEAQDCTPAIMDVLLSQRCGKILVGDPHQQIYTFKGAINALHTVNHTHIFYLTQSFRFGAEIAYVGATILKVCKKVEKILVGGKQKDGVCDETANKAMEARESGVSQIPGKIGILSRCNVGVFKEAAKLTDANPHCRIHFIGDVKKIGLEKIMDIYHLMTWPEKTKSIKDAMIRSFTTRKKIEDPFKAFKTYVMQMEDKELDGKLSIVETYKQRIPELVARLKCCSESDVRRADFIVGTVHKAKGLEFDTVIVNDDFVTIPSARHELEYHTEFSFYKIPSDEWNLLYVAVTRAKTSVVISKSILRILTMAGEYFLKSQMRVSLPGGDPLPCSISNCPNCITPESSFTMYKQKMQCIDHTTDEGPLCERCAWMRVGPIAFLMTDDVLSMAEIPGRLEPPIHHPFFMELFF